LTKINIDGLSNANQDLIVSNPAQRFLRTFQSALDTTDPASSDQVSFASNGAFDSAYAVTDFAAAAIAAAGQQLAVLIASGTGSDAGADTALPKVHVDATLASWWFGTSLRPIGWALPPTWDPIAGDYQTHDGWIRLHTNAPHHRAAALRALAISDAATLTRNEVANAVRRYRADELESAVVAEGGVAAAMRSRDQWLQHPQGTTVSNEPLIASEQFACDDRSAWRLNPQRPLEGIRVLDLTRILAGPVATRFLAGYGAQVLRIDPPQWDEPSLVADVTLGKRCAKVDLHQAHGRQVFAELLRSTDVLVHGYRADALENLGFGASTRRELNPGLIDVSLNAYGHTGLWTNRRGFDSLVQMSCGIAHEGMEHFGTDRPTPLPVQALDHATGYLMAATVVRALRQRIETSHGTYARLSLARTAQTLMHQAIVDHTTPLPSLTDSHYNRAIETTAWGQLQRLTPPLEIDGAPQYWTIPAAGLGTAPPAWV
jgi:crotonobetainyl-CoA:carnitine CoA-transferase CaiB-like acyl-CoA transferase